MASTMTARGGCGCQEVAMPAGSSAPAGRCDDCAPAGLVGRERTRWFPRQLVGPADLSQDQIYVRDRLRRHNRLMHGWGIVCGAEIESIAGESCTIRICPGYVLTPCGDEILFENDVIADFCHAAEGETVCGRPDPWCRDTPVVRDPGTPLYVVVCYRECLTRPVHVPVGGCGCGDDDCEYSRIRDHFEVRFTPELPADYPDDAIPPTYPSITCNPRQGGPPGCPPCTTENCVVLGTVTPNPDGEPSIGGEYRRYAASFGSWWFRCGYQEDYLRSDMRALEYRVTTAGATPDEPVGTVPVLDSSGRWMTLAADFPVEAGDTVRTLVAREGGRVMTIPTTGETTTLGDVVAMAGADPDAAISHPLDLARMLEAKRLDPSSLAIARTALADVIDEPGMNRLRSAGIGDPAAAAALPATTLKGLSPRSDLGRKLSGMSIAEVAAMPEADLNDLAEKGLKVVRAVLGDQVAGVHAAARRAVQLATAWG